MLRCYTIDMALNVFNLKHEIRPLFSKILVMYFSFYSFISLLRMWNQYLECFFSQFDIEKKKKKLEFNKIVRFNLATF